MYHDFSLLLVSLKSGNLTRDEFISVVETCNKIIADADTVHFPIIQQIVHDNNPKTRTEFAKEFSIQVEKITEYKLRIIMPQR